MGINTLGTIIFACSFNQLPYSGPLNLPVDEQSLAFHMAIRIPTVVDTAIHTATEARRSMLILMGMEIKRKKRVKKNTATATMDIHTPR